MQIEEAKKILSDEITALNVGHEKYEKAVETLIYYIEMMHSELDRLEGIEDNTSMLKQELEETKEDLLLAYKVIDEMAEYISHLDIDEDICMKNIANTELCNEEYSLCKKCIKEYFYKKASDNK